MIDRSYYSFLRANASIPTERLQAIRRIDESRHISNPAAIGFAVVDLGSAADPVSYRLRDEVHRHASVRRTDIEYVVSVVRLCGNEQHGINEVLDVEVGLLLRPIAKHIQAVGRRLQLPNEVKDDAMCGGNADDVRKPKDIRPKTTSFHRSSDLGFRCELHRTVIGDRSERPNVFVDLNMPQIAIDCRTRSKMQTIHIEFLSHNQRVERRQECILQVNPGIELCPPVYRNWPPNAKCTGCWKFYAARGRQPGTKADLRSPTAWKVHAPPATNSLRKHSWPRQRLSIATTRSPRAIRRRMSVTAINPAPPVTKCTVMKTPRLDFDRVIRDPAAMRSDDQVSQSSSASRRTQLKVDRSKRVRSVKMGLPQVLRQDMH